MKKGTVQIIENFIMPELGRSRTLRIYLPPDYNEGSRRYPVIYMHDAQNLFTAETSSFGAIWDAGTAVDKLYSENPEKAYIIVGIDHGNELRLSEYSPWYSEILHKGLPHEILPGGEGFKYIDFLVSTLKPFIDKKYRTLKDRNNTAVCGSSMGGLISVCAGIKYQNVFSKIAALSSAMYVTEEEIKDLIISTGKKQHMKIYMDVGTREAVDVKYPDAQRIFMDGNKNVYSALKKIGFDDSELKFVIAEGGIHSETEWCKRFPGMLNWLFK